MDNVTTPTVTPPVTPPVRNPMTGFSIHFAVYAAVIAMLAGLNYYAGPPYWVQWVFAGWGIGIIAHGLAAFLKRSSTRA